MAFPFHGSQLSEAPGWVYPDRPVLHPLRAIRGKFGTIQVTGIWDVVRSQLQIPMAAERAPERKVMSSHFQ